MVELFRSLSRDNTRQEATVRLKAWSLLPMVFTNKVSIMKARLSTRPSVCLGINTPVAV